MEPAPPVPLALLVEPAPPAPPVPLEPVEVPTGCSAPPAPPAPLAPEPVEVECAPDSVLVECPASGETLLVAPSEAGSSPGGSGCGLNKQLATSTSPRMESLRITNLVFERTLS